MTSGDETGRWLGIDEAVALYGREVGLSGELLRERIPRQPGTLWLSDRSIAVHEVQSRLVVDRLEFAALLRGIAARRDAPPPAWPHGEAEEDRWIGLEEALAIHARRLGMPEGFHRELLGALDYRPGIVWLSDHALVLYERPSGLGFDRADFDAIRPRAG